VTLLDQLLGFWATRKVSFIYFQRTLLAYLFLLTLAYIVCKRSIISRVGLNEIHQ